MLSGKLSEWPFQWPPPSFDRLQQRPHPELVQVLRRSIEVDPRRRFRNAEAMLEAFLRVKVRAPSGMLAMAAVVSETAQYNATGARFAKNSSAASTERF